MKVNGASRGAWCCIGRGADCRRRAVPALSTAGSSGEVVNRGDLLSLPAATRSLGAANRPAERVGMCHSGGTASLQGEALRQPTFKMSHEDTSIGRCEGDPARPARSDFIHHATCDTD
jgi:hypothetical protein